MLKNTHKLRLQTDNPNGFILHCMSELSEEGVRRTIELNKDKEGIRETIARLSVCESDFVAVRGVKGVFLIRGYCDVIPQAFYTLDGYAYAFELITSENNEPMIRSAYTLEQILSMLLIASELPGKVFASMRANPQPAQVEPASIGYVWGSPAQTYYTFIHANEEGLRLELRETEINPHNEGGTVKVIVPANAEEIRKYRMNVQRFVDELKIRPEQRTMRIL